jgi:hypothetical protein
MSPFAKFSPESRIENRIKHLGITITYLSALTYKNYCAVSPTKLSLALAGNRALPGDLGEKVVSLLDELIALQKMCEPLELKFTNSEKTTAVLNLMRDDRLFIVVGKSEEEVAANAGGALLAGNAEDATLFTD